VATIKQLYGADEEIPMMMAMRMKISICAISIAQDHNGGTENSLWQLAPGLGNE